MKMAKDDVSVVMEIPGAVARLESGFGDASGYGKMSGEYFSLDAGVDTTELFEGLEDDLCQCPHWGYVLRGEITRTDANGERETVRAEELFYWPPGHNVRIEADADFVMFSPESEHRSVINHMLRKVEQSQP